MVRRKVAARKYWCMGFCFLSNCANAGIFVHRVNAEDLERIHTIAVIARTGDTFHWSYIGTVVFANRAFDAPVPQWDMNDVLVEQVTSGLNARNRFHAEPLDTKMLDLPNLYQKPGAILDSREVIATLAAAAKQQGADTLLVAEMAPSSENAPFFRAGFGLMVRHAFGLERVCAYAQMNFALFTTDTGKQITRTYKVSCQPDDTLRNLPAKTSWAEYDSEARATFEAADRVALRDEVKSVMGEFKLLDQ